MNNSILIVDDEYLIRFALSTAFEQNGKRITAVATGRDALREINSVPYDLCILDLHLPDANGLDIMKTALTVSPKTKIIIITGYEIENELLKSLLSQGCGFLMKPFELDDITTLADTLLGNADAGHDTVPGETVSRHPHLP